MGKYITVCIVLLSLSWMLALPAGCTFLKKSSGSSSAVAVSSEPLTSNWKMTRVSIDPSFPAVIPGLIIDQVIPKSPTWSISLSGSQLKPTYDGRSTWFNPLGIAVTVNTPAITESQDKKSVILKGGGVIQAASLPGALSLVSAAAGGVSNLKINYTDAISVTLISQDQISVTITYSSRGTFTGSKGPDSFNNSATVKYTGTRK